MSIVQVVTCGLFVHPLIDEVDSGFECEDRFFPLIKFKTLIEVTTIIYEPIHFAWIGLPSPPICVGHSLIVQ